MDVSIIIVNWNTRDVLRNCLKSIYEQAGQVNFEVIVIDNASTDRSSEMVRSEFSQAFLIENTENKGFATANNQGMAIANGRYVLLLNSDTLVLNNAIATTLSFADAHQEAAVVGCRVLNPDRTLQSTCFMFPSILNMLLSSSYLYKLFPNSKFFGRERMTWWNRSDIRQVDVVSGCFMLVRRKAIEQTGMLDEQYFMYAEETDWCYRFKQVGWKILFTPDSQIIHFGGQSSKQVALEMALQLRASILQFFRKHRSHFEYRGACFLVLVFFAVRIPIWFIAWLISKKDRSYCWLRLRIYLVGIWKLLTSGAGSLHAKAFEF